MTPDQREAKNSKQREKYKNRSLSEIEERKSYLKKQWETRKISMTPEQKQAMSQRNIDHWRKADPDKKIAMKAAQRYWYNNAYICKERASVRLENRIKRSIEAHIRRNARASEAWRNMSQEQRDSHNARNRERYLLPKVKEAAKESHRKWVSEHLQQVKSKNHRYKASIRRIVGSFTSDEWMNLVEKCNHTCIRCGRKEPEIKLTVDHIFPVSKGGCNYISNIQPLCFSCNCSKGNRV